MLAVVRYDELLTLLNTTAADDWVQLAPPRVEQIKVNGDGVEEVWLAGHHSVAFWSGNLDVSVMWGADQNDGPWDGVWGEWSTFPDHAVFGIWAELAWRGQPVHRQVLAVADGGRYYIPAPNAVMQDGTTKIDGWVVERADLPLARLIDSLEHPHNDLDETLGRTGLKVRD